MRIVLIILFAALYLGNSHICTYLVPYDYNDPSTYHLYEKWWQVRDVIYEVMFLILLAIPLYKRSKVSRAILFALGLLIFFSAVDKLQGVNEYHFHDLFILLVSIIAAFEAYRYYASRKKT